MFAALLLAIPAVTLPGLRTALAQAKDAEKEDETDEGGGDESDAAKPDPDQPLVTSGGNYSIASFPLSEVERTLLIPQGGLEAWLTYSFDIRTKVGDESQSFKTHTFDLFARYGVAPTTNVLATFTIDAAAPDTSVKHRALDGAVEQAIVYDLLDVRGGVAINFPDPGDSFVDVFVGLPVKYRLNSKIALIGLEKILNIHTKEIALASGKTSSTPDLIFSLAGEANPIPQLAILLRASLNLTAADFDSRSLPLELTVQYTVNKQFDLGLQLVAKNIAPPSSPPGVASLGALDQLGMGLFIRGRM